MSARHGFAAIVLLGAFGLAAPASAEGPPAPAVEQCIRDNAAKVETAVGDLNQAVDFLVGKVCAGPVAEDNSRVMKLQQQRMTAQWRAMCDKQKTDNSAKPAIDLCAVQNMSFAGVANDDDSAPAYGVFNPPPAAIALAARLLLDLRLSHSNSRQPR